MTSPISRRELLAGSALLGVAGNAPAAQKQPSRDPFIYSFNTSTIQGQKLSITAEVDIAAKAGYGAIEPWINELERFTQDGGNLRDLGRRIADAGLRVESSIGFAEWVVDDEGRRKKGLETARRDMDMVRQIGGGAWLLRRSAPPTKPICPWRAPPNVIAPSWKLGSRWASSRKLKSGVFPAP